MALEIEFRARFDSKKYNTLKKYLDTHAKSLGEDNKDCYYFIFPDKLLKLVNNVSKGTAKISLKLNHIGKGAAFPEFECYFRPDQFNVAKKIFEHLALPAKIMYGPQQRLNYFYKNCEIALKYSDVWGYHMEIERVIDGQKEQEEAERCIGGVAEELDVQLMSEEELQKFTEEAESKI